MRLKLSCEVDWWKRPRSLHMGHSDAVFMRLGTELNVLATKIEEVLQ